MATGKALPTSRHFELHQVADGIYAAIGTPGTGSGSNAGIIDLGDVTLVFDTFQTPQAAEDLRAAAEQLTGRGVGTVINSHWHADHIHGNQVFASAPETKIIATKRTGELMAARGPKVVGQFKEHAAGQLQKLEATLHETQDEQQRAELLIEIGETREFVACAPTLTLRLPDQVFEERLLLQGNKRTAALVTFGGGHTESDAFLLIPGERLAFLGDLLFVQSHLWIGHGDAAEWRRIIQRVQTLDLQTCVPGHGPIGTPEDFPTEIRYLETIEEIVEDALQKGTPAEEAAATPIPAEYASWAWGVGWSANIQSLIEKARKEKAGG
jgi:glyoxylase-like metal-dependent hydrolase (beta-lactamase superfamily II)